MDRVQHLLPKLTKSVPMKSSNVILAVVGVMLSLIVPQLARGQSEAEPKPVASVTSLGAKPIGYLEVPLGTVVRATGIVIDGDTIGDKANWGKTLLRVTTVNGKDLPKPVDFEFKRAPKSLQKPAPGEQFDYYLHEYGHFDGIVRAPKELGIDEPVTANDGFNYRRYVEIHASNTVSK